MGLSDWRLAGIACLLIAGCTNTTSTQSTPSPPPFDSSLYYPGSTLQAGDRFDAAESVVALRAKSGVAEATLMDWYRTTAKARGWKEVYAGPHVLLFDTPTQPGARLIVLVTLVVGDGPGYVQAYSITYNDPAARVRK